MRCRTAVLAIVSLGALCAAVFCVAQDGAQRGGQPDAETPAGQLGAAQAPQGQVSVRKAGSSDFEPLAPGPDGKYILFPGDSIRTSEASSVVVTLVDGTIVELGPNSELGLALAPEGAIEATLALGEANVSIGSDGFVLRVPRHTLTGRDSQVVVKVAGPNAVSMLAVEDGVVVRNEFGFVTHLDQGRKIEVTFLEDRNVFQVNAHEYNELDVKLEVRGEEKFLAPGESVAIDSQLNVTKAKPVEVALKRPVVMELPLVLEEPYDEPFENAGDISTIYKVSPKRP